MHVLFKKTIALLTIGSIFLSDIACCMQDEPLLAGGAFDDSVRVVARPAPVPVAPPAAAESAAHSSEDQKHSPVPPAAIVQAGAVVVRGTDVAPQSPGSPLVPRSLELRRGPDNADDVQMRTVRRDQLRSVISADGDQLMGEPVAGHGPGGELGQALLPDQQSRDLARFLETMGWSEDALANAQHPELSINARTLQRVAQVELRFCPPRWVSFDHFFEKIFYAPLLDWEGIVHADAEGVEPKCCHRFWIRGRSVPLKSTKTLRKAVAVNSLREGIEDGVLDALHLTLFTLLGYQLTHTTAINLVDTFRQADHTSVLGIANLMHEEPAVFSVLIIPFAVGMGKALWNMCSIDDRPDLRMRQAIRDIESYTEGIWTDYLRPLLPLPPLDRYLSNLQRLILWEGRASQEDREKAFQTILDLANNRKGYSQATAMHSLARIAHGLHLKDFNKLRHLNGNGEHAHDDATLRHFLSMKTRALETLEGLSDQRGNFCDRMNARYADYLIWTLGQSSLKNSVVMGAFKLGKTALQITFLKMLIESIIEYVNCPDKPGFSWTGGYQSWSSDYSVHCFDELVREFNLIPGQPVNTLTDQIGQYHFPGNTYALDLSNKGLDGDSVLEIVQGFVRNGIMLTALNLAGNGVNKARFFETLFPLLPSVTWLSLANNGIEETDIGSTSADTIALAQSLGNFTTLTHLDLSGNWFGYVNSYGAVALGNNLRYIPTLNFLSFSYNYYMENIDSNGTIALGNSLQYLPFLAFLDLSINGIGSVDSQGTIAIGNGLTNLRFLTSLDLSQNYIGYTDSQGTVAIANGLQNLISLTSLDLSTNLIGRGDSRGVISLAKTLPSLKNLQNFKIYSQLPFLNSTYVTLLNQALNSTKVQRPVQSSLFTPQDLDTYFSAVPPHVTFLNFSTLIGNSQIIPLLMKRLTNYTFLTALDLSTNWIGYEDPQGEIELANGLGYLRSLTWLDLSTNYIGDTDFRGTTALGRSLSKLTSLTSLSVSNNEIGSTDSNGTIALGNGLQYLTSLTSLDLSLNYIEWTDSQGAIAIGNGLKNLRSLTFLDLSDSGLGIKDSRGVTALANGLKNLSSLTYIDLSTNWIGWTDSQSTVLLGNALEDLTSLKVCQLSWNDIGFRGADGPRVILEALPKLPHLQTIGLAGAQNISWTQGAQILANLKGDTLRGACEAEICFNTPINPSNNQDQNQQLQTSSGVPSFKAGKALPKSILKKDLPFERVRSRKAKPKQVRFASGVSVAPEPTLSDATKMQSKKPFQTAPVLTRDSHAVTPFVAAQSAKLLPQSSASSQSYPSGHPDVSLPSSVFVQASSAAHRAQPMGMRAWKTVSSAVESAKSWLSLDAWIKSATRGAFNLAVERDANTGQLVNVMPATFPNLLKPNHYGWAVLVDEPNQPDAQTPSAERSQLLLNSAVLRTLPSYVQSEQQPQAISQPLWPTLGAYP